MQGGDPDQKRDVLALKTTLLADRAAARKETECLARLVDIRATKAGSKEGSTAEAGYAAVFREAGIDPETLPDAEVGKRVRVAQARACPGTGRRTRRLGRPRRTEKKDPTAASKLLAVARLADPDTWRDRLRSALDQPAGKDRLKSLQELAATAQIEQLPAVSLDLLGALLLDEGDANTAANVLRKAQRVHPNDGWLKYNLARSLHRLGKTQEAIRYFMAARTIHPETAHELRARPGRQRRN